MAIIHCPDCGKDVSDQAAFCIHCGYPIREMQEKQALPQVSPGRGRGDVSDSSDVPDDLLMDQDHVAAKKRSGF